MTRNFLLFVYVFYMQVNGFILLSSRRQTQVKRKLLQAERNNGLLSGLFSLSEALGRITSIGRNPNDNSAKISTSSRSIQQVGELIRREYENIFWVTGDMDLALWADNCTFADPFSSFGGPGSSTRFKANADNLGRFVVEPRLKVTSFSIQETTVSVGWTFSSQLKLPWRPVLAAAGETKHRLNADTLLIEEYTESWKSDPWRVVARLFVPGKRNSASTPL